MDPLTIAAAAAQGFEALRCEECARNILDALHAAGYRGDWVELRGNGGRDFMICLSYDAGQATITNNGRHVGVRVQGVVFDNLHPGGMPYDEWVRDFDAVGGVTPNIKPDQ